MIRILQGPKCSHKLNLTRLRLIHYSPGHTSVAYKAKNASFAALGRILYKEVFAKNLNTSETLHFINSQKRDTDVLSTMPADIRRGTNPVAS
jgi:hypothetical protein